MAAVWEEVGALGTSATDTSASTEIALTRTWLDAMRSTSAATG